jgi:hypothetical protein
VEALGKGRRANLPAEHTGSRGAPASMSGPPRCRSVHPAESGSLLPPVPPRCSSVGR